MNFDLVIRGGEVIDGSGSPRARADVGVTAGRIAAIGNDLRPGHEEFDACGLIVAPGFIDAHTHDDQAVLTSPAMINKVSQGVTTVVTGNCGISLAPFIPGRALPPPLDLLGGGAVFRHHRFADWRSAIDRAGTAVNIVPLVGHTTLRAAVMAEHELAQPASVDAQAQMLSMLREALQQGAWGLSSGLYYPSAKAASAEEVVALVAEVARVGGVYATHLRDEGVHVVAALEEAIGAARQTGCRLVVSHHKCAGAAAWGLSRRTLPLFESAAVAGEVGFDVYPYDAASTTLLPERIEQSRKVLITRSEPEPQAAGRYLGDIAAEWRVSAAHAMERLQPGGAVYFMLDEEEVERILAHPMAMVGSDGMPHDTHPHPRLWGTFPRVLGRYVRERRLFSLEQAVHKMSGLTARRFGIADRGELRCGLHADITVFDPCQVADNSSFERPTLTSSGIASVWVEGVRVWTGSDGTGQRPGRVLRREA